ncbi:MAG: hypothetical protein P4L46_03470 [Fimbriimonas sp.]|nr:hypothetical protein [Fimbriimonas sp.]
MRRIGRGLAVTGQELNLQTFLATRPVHGVTHFETRYVHFLRHVHRTVNIAQ